MVRLAAPRKTLVTRLFSAVLGVQAVVRVFTSAFFDPPGSRAALLGDGFGWLESKRFLRSFRGGVDFMGELARPDYQGKE